MLGPIHATPNIDQTQPQISTSMNVMANCLLFSAWRDSFTRIGFRNSLPQTVQTSTRFQNGARAAAGATAAAGGGGAAGAEDAWPLVSAGATALASIDPECMPNLSSMV